MTQKNKTEKIKNDVIKNKKRHKLKYIEEKKNQVKRKKLFLKLENIQLN